MTITLHIDFTTAIGASENVRSCGYEMDRADMHHLQNKVLL